ncbi:hypothetical protein [Peterkaempfera bronchialis]|uniref:Uncharacterized protein n=1 Tax=Peterkaempfera bronchialis TaxID=2126346 RepID=A0A345T2X9_9ACTN|nr:hypothetical protein [Peterkaempfera bronchialis]AXI80334.1 hypothetical protein C7M71_025965 [Peterkaempfera bronchialis]
MSRRPEPPRITFGGKPAVVLSPEDYQSLAAARRQVGGQATRIKVLRRELADAVALLAEAEAQLADHHRHPADAPADGPADAAAPCAGCGLLESVREWMRAPQRSGAPGHSAAEPGAG